MKLWKRAGTAILLVASLAGPATADKYSEPADAYFRHLMAGEFSAVAPGITLNAAGKSRTLTESDLRELLKDCDILMTQMGLISRDPFRFFYYYGANCPAPNATFSALKLKLTQAPTADRFESVEVTPSAAKIVLPPPPPRRSN